MAKASQSIPDSYRASEWYEALTTYLREMDPALKAHGPGQITDAQAEKIHDRFIEATKAVFRKQIRTFSDLATLAGACVHWNGDVDRPYPSCVIEDPKLGFDDKSLAYLVRAVLDMCGLALDAEGLVSRRET